MSNDDFDFDALPPEKQQVILSQANITKTALKFLNHFYADSDLRASWELIDPTLKLCWAQWWIDANSGALESQGYDLIETAQNLVDNGSRHEVWEDFERVILRDLRAAFPLKIDQVGIGAEPRVITLNVQLLYIHKNAPEGGAWKPNESSEVVPLVLRIVDSEWKILNLGYDTIPEPGWPPQLRSSVS